MLTLTLPALFAYIIASTAALQGSGGIAEEVNGGTLEQAHLSPARPSLLAAGRLAALAAEALIPAMTSFLTALGNEVRKGLLFAWAERLQIALELPFFTIFILLLGPMLGAGHQIAAGHLNWTLNSGRISLLMIAFVQTWARAAA